MYGQALSAYKKSAVNTIQDPQRLIKMLFEKAIVELNLAKDSFHEPRRLSQHLGKVIAIVGELQSGLNFEKGGEAAQFLYGLYGAMIRELSKVDGSDEGQVGTLDLAQRYLAELKRIWAEQVLHQTPPEEKKGAEAQVANL